MSYRSVNDLIIVDTFEKELSTLKNGDRVEDIFCETFELLQNEFPSLNEKELVHIIQLLIETYNSKKTEKVELVVTAPPAYGLKTKLTENVVRDMLVAAQKSIFMTGYSVSEYIDDFIDLIISKSQRGVFVKIFFNDIDNQDSIKKLLMYKGKFLEIYNYKNEEDKMSALHAKVICVDDRETLVSSANLSYHGMSGNIELGCHICSEELVKKINELFKQLVFKKIFTKV